jgi:hypothetical protein
LEFGRYMIHGWFSGIVLPASASCPLA